MKKKDRAYIDAHRDMIHDGFLDRREILTPSIKISDIIDPFVKYGFVTGSSPNKRPKVYLDMCQRHCNAIGALVLGIDEENKFPRIYSEGLMANLSARFGVTPDFLNGLSAGFNGQNIIEECPDNLLNQDMKDGYQFGCCVWQAYSEPTTEN